MLSLCGPLRLGASGEALSKLRCRKAACSLDWGGSRGRLAFGATGEGLGKAGLGRRGGRGWLVATTLVRSKPKRNNSIANEGC